jgi:hypothetical protein
LGEKIGAFRKNQFKKNNLKKHSNILSKKCQIFTPIFGRKYFQNYNIGPRLSPVLRSMSLTAE